MRRFTLYDKQDTKTSRGVLSKAWYTDEEGRKLLVKGNTRYNNITGFEPYSEEIASRIAKVLGIPCVRYVAVPSRQFKEVKTYGIGHVSICRKIEISDTEQQMSVCKYLDTINKNRVTDYFNAYYRSGLSMESLYRMLIFDAVVGNADRHLNNWDVAVSPQEVKLLPILDNGASLLAWGSNRDIQRNFVIGKDISKPFKKTHREQIAFLKRYKERYCTEILFRLPNMKIVYNKIIEECNTSLLKLGKVDKQRELAVRKYIKARLIYLEWANESGGV